MHRVKISAASARQRFHGCEPDYILNVCHANCCRDSTNRTGDGTLVTVHKTEVDSLRARGATVEDNRVHARSKSRCFFMDAKHLCSLHGVTEEGGGDAKPFGCVASPFTLNSNDTLIVRNRYRSLRCYKDDRDGPAPPAYEAFRTSLDTIFGRTEAERIVAHLVAGGGDMYARMPDVSYTMLHDNDAAKPKALPKVRSKKQGVLFRS